MSLAENGMDPHALDSNIVVMAHPDGMVALQSGSVACHLTTSPYIYTEREDDTLTEIKRVAEADRLKIPYRVAIDVAKSLDSLNLENENDLLNFVGGNIDKVDKIIKATFAVTDTELECVDLAELGNVAGEIYKWGLEKINSLKGGQEKN